MAEPIKITIYRNLSVDDFTQSIADPNRKLEAGSSAAAVAAIAAANLEYAAKEASASHPEDDTVDWCVRNAEILRSYMIKLIDEDVKCRNPLVRARRESDQRKEEAARQVAVSICLEIVNMMGKCLEIAEKLLSYLDQDSIAHVVESADLAYSASLTAGRFVLDMSRFSSDDTYRYVMKRENELTMSSQKACYDRITGRGQEE